MVFPGMAYNYVNSKTFVIEIGSALLIFAGCVSLSKNDVRAYFKSGLAVAMAASLVISVMASLASIDPSASWFSQPERGTGTLFTALVALGAMAASIMVRKTRSVNSALLYPVLAAGSAIGISAMLGYTGFNVIHAKVLSVVANGGGLTGNSSFAGSYLLISILVGMYLLAMAKERSKKIWTLAGIFFSVFNPVILGFGVFRGSVTGLSGLMGDAQGAAVSLFMGILLFAGIFASFSRDRVMKWSGRILASITVAVTIAAVVMLCIPGTFVHESFARKASGTRFLYWNISLQSASDHPVIGTGPETFRYAHEHYFNSDFMLKTMKREVYADKPHNAYLETLVSEGVLGLVAFVCVIGFAILATVHRARKGDRAGASMFAAVILAYLLNNLILFDVNASFFAWTLILAWLAAEDAGIPEGKDSPVRDHAGPRYVATAAGAAVLVLTVVVVSMNARKLSVMLDEMYAPLSQRVGMYQKTESISSYGAGINIAQRVYVYVENYLSHMNEILASGPQAQALIVKDVDSMAEALETAASKYRETSQGAVSLARLGTFKIALLNSVDPAALRMVYDGARKAIEISPNNPQGYWMLAQAYAYEGKFDQSLDVAQQAVALNPKIPESYATVIAIARMSGNERIAEQASRDFEKNVDPADR